MKIAKARQLKNQLAGDIAQLKELLAKQNSRSTSRSSTTTTASFDAVCAPSRRVDFKVRRPWLRPTRKFTTKFSGWLTQGLVATLTSLDTKPVCFTKVVASASRVTKSNTCPAWKGGRGQARRRVAGRNQTLQDALDEFNFTAQ